MKLFFRKCLFSKATEQLIELTKHSHPSFCRRVFFTPLELFNNIQYLTSH